MMKIKIVVPAAAVVLGVVLAGCGDSDSMGGMDMGSESGQNQQPEAGVEFNDADITFAQEMYPHHAQAVEMAELVDGRTENQAVIDLAAQIGGAQAPEMDQMAALLESFGEPAPSGEMGGMDHSGMPGMMSSEDMDALAQATGAAFDRMWLTMMIEHHNGAIEMANTELADGSNTDARQLATDIIEAQQAEIETMNGLLGSA